MTNQWLPLVPGVVMEYECDTDEGLEGTVVEVLPDVRVVDGARPGIILGADPGAHPGEAYRQEYDEGEAEDFGRALDLGNDVVVPWDTSAGCLRTEDWNALEPGGREHKYYCPGGRPGAGGRRRLGRTRRGAGERYRAVNGER
ncbi:MAG TPA: hypothetical protein VJ773_01165 [Gemmatimonadales bacterium]|nr:hypothetical protein [Gemmatimonadales bacterium]